MCSVNTIYLFPFSLLLSVLIANQFLTTTQMYTFSTHFCMTSVIGHLLWLQERLLFPLLCCFMDLDNEMRSEIMFFSVSQLIETKSVFQNCFRFCSAVGEGAQNACCTTKQLTKQLNSMLFVFVVSPFVSFVCLKCLIR